MKNPTNNIVLFTVFGKTLKGLLVKTTSRGKLIIESGAKKYHIPAGNILSYA